MDAVRYLYETNIFHGKPEVYFGKKKLDMNIVFKLNVDLLSDSTVIEGKTWSCLKESAMRPGFKHPKASRSLTQLISAQKVQGDLNPICL